MSRRRDRRGRPPRSRGVRRVEVIAPDDDESRGSGVGGCGGAAFIGAIAIIIVGAYFLLQNFGVWETIPLRWGYLWPSALIALGLWLMIRSRRIDKVGIALITVGGFFLLNALGAIPGGIWGYAWPVVLIAVGLAIILPRFIIKRRG